MKKILLLLCALLTGVGSAMAETYTITYDTSTGSFYKNGAASGGWVNQWVSNEAGKPAVTLTASANNINADNGRMAPGTTQSCTYSLSVEDGYKITGFELNCPTSGAQVTVTPNGEAAVVAAAGENIVVTSSATSFVYSGSNSGRILAASTGDGGSFKIFVEDVPAEKVAAYNTAKGWINFIQSANGLVKDASKYISNAKSSAEGTYEALLDGVYTTYFHTAYGDAGPDADHYLQAELTEAVDAIHFYYKKRSQNNANRPTSITISGSNDGTSFTDITTINSGLPTDASVIDYASDKVSLGASYKYLRFTVTATNTGAASNGHVFFTFSEFYIMPANEDIDAAITMLKNLPANAGELTDAQVTEINTINTALTSTTVNVTYELYESDGTTLVSSETVVQNKNSEVAIPSSLVSSTYFNYSTEGTIGTSDCTIKVTRTLKDGSIVYPISNLSNTKAYKVVVPRGTYTTVDGNLANTVKNADYAINNFAFISYEDNYYMWSIADSKFAGNGYALSETPIAVTFSANTVPSYQIKAGSNTLNASSGLQYGAAFDTWSTADDGNRCVLYVVEDFDPTAALAALEEYFHPAAEKVFEDAIAQLETYTYGTGLGQYSLVVESTDYTSQAATIISGLKTQGYTADNLTTAQLMLNGTNLNMPKANTFFRIRSILGDKPYLTAPAVDGRATFTSATDNSTVFFLTEDNHLVSLATGLGFKNVYNGAADIKASGISGNVFNMIEAVNGNAGQYSIVTTHKENPTYLYSTGANGSNADRNTYSAGWVDNNSFTLEVADVNTLPVAISAAGYATLYSPVALTVPSGVQAYVGKVNGNYLVMTAIDAIPAQTGVVLKATEGTYDFAVAASADAAESDLQGVTVAQAVTNALTLQNIGEVGFYGYTGATLAGFKAYLPKSAGVKGLTLSFGDETAVQGISTELPTSRVIYSLAGQRVQKAQKGIYVVNGKKVVIK